MVLILSLCGVTSHSFAAGQAVIHGQVVDEATREPLRKVRVSLAGAEGDVTGDDGKFRIGNLPAGDYTVTVSTVGYRMLRRELTLADGETRELIFHLGQEAATVSETVRVTAPLFEEVEKAAVSQHTLNKTELKNLAGVLVDDPLRSVQSLPGVAAGDDFQSYYSVRGGNYVNNGLLLDGVLTHNLVHTVQGAHDTTGSVSVLNGDLVDSVALYSGAFAPKYGDRTASYLDVVTRDGSRDRTRGRVAVSGTNAAIVGEGPTGADGRNSWIASARKSYADYLVRRLGRDSDLVLGFVDFQAKISREASDRNRFGAGMVWGRSHLSRDPENRGITSLINAQDKSGILTAWWTLLPGSRTFVDNRAYFLDERYSNRNRESELLGDGRYTEFAFRSDVSHSFGGSHRIETGTLVRFVDTRLLDRRYNFGTLRFLDFENIAGSFRQTAGYFQDRVSTPGGRLSAIAGVRFEKSGLTGQGVWNPRASLDYRISGSQKLEAGWGIVTQFPDVQPVLGRNGDRRLRAITSRHHVLAYEWLAGERTRVRVEWFDKEESNLPSDRENMWRLVGGAVTPPNPDFRHDSALRASSRGIEIVVQRRSANRLAGWVSYSCAKTRVKDLATGESYDGDFDQRHTVNVYGSYRLSDKWNFSAKARLGSNFPYPEYFQKEGADFYLASSRNTERLPFYSRVDVRANRAFYFSRSKLSLYLEVLNILNRENIRFDQITGVNTRTSRVRYSKDSLFPILPTAGFTLEF